MSAIVTREARLQKFKPPAHLLKEQLAISPRNNGELKSRFNLS